jgi:hypothetical protein
MILYKKDNETKKTRNVKKNILNGVSSMRMNGAIYLGEPLGHAFTKKKLVLDNSHLFVKIERFQLLHDVMKT